MNRILSTQLPAGGLDLTVRVWVASFLILIAFLIGLPSWCLMAATGYLVFLGAQEVVRRRYEAAETACALARAVADLVAMGVLVASTGALTTVFVAIYPVLVAGAASLWGRAAGRAALAASTLSYGGVLLGTYLSWWPYLWFEAKHTPVHEVFASHPVWGGHHPTVPFIVGFVVIATLNYVAYFFPIRLIALRMDEAGKRLQLDHKLQEAQHHESLVVLAGGVAHDFNNLLMAIMGNAQLAEQVIEKDSQARKYITQMQNTARRAGELTRQLLVYAGKVPAVIQRVDLSEVGRETTHLLRVSIPQDVACEYALGEELPPVSGDGAQVRQLVMNLVVNASESMNGGPGRIDIRTGRMNIDRDSLRSFAVGADAPGGDYVYLEVTDTGCGMSEELQQRIFDPFFTTKGSGHGLGLAAVQGIVRVMHGALRVRSAPGQGTAFLALFPVEPTEDADGPASAT